MSFSIGDKVKIQLFGQSHSEAIGVVIEDLPAGKHIHMDKIEAFLLRRRGGRNTYSTPRKESDKPKILSGLVRGKTCGAPLCAVFENTDTISKDYNELKTKPRPSHTDYVAHVKYNRANDIRGGGQFSGRLTLPLCFAGAICKQLLEEERIYIGAHILSVGDIRDTPYSPTKVGKADFKTEGFPANSSESADRMIAKMTAIAQEGDSIGGIIECAAIGLPVGVGEPMFGGLENRIAAAVFAVPAVKGIEFGSGFSCSKMLGSEHNDPFFIENGEVKTRSNNSGGIQGGISNSMPIIFRVAIKPTPSISKRQDTVNLEQGIDTTLEIKGRHDPCIVPRAVPCIEAAAAIAIYDLLRHM